MKKHLLCLITTILIAASLNAQPNYNYEKLQREDLGRGVVAIRKDASTVTVSWRYLSSDPMDTGFNVYRNGKKITPEPVNAGTFYDDSYASPDAATYEVRPVVKEKNQSQEQPLYPARQCPDRLYPNTDTEAGKRCHSCGRYLHLFAQ